MQFTNLAGELWPLAAYFIAVIILIMAMLSISHVLGERHKGRATDEPFEAGVPTTGTARQRLTAKFYLVAMFFVIFDLEAVFIIAWALAARSLGWAGYIEILVFIGVLLAALVYLWRLGALDWGPRT
ncbi:MAG TPA: NADH-quinone oxidoreductase subunit A [Anaerolineales bacterium]|nr:NADH-quinone oxidoreductase subunit A [Anaerolineales bacterium]